MTAAILTLRPAIMPGTVASNGTTRPLVCLLGLDRLPARRTPLVCHWLLDADGRLSCRWEPDPLPVSQL